MSLREKLHEITDAGVEASFHRGRVVALAYDFPHSIEWLNSEIELNLYNCFMFALHLQDNSDYQYIIDRYCHIKANSDFMSYLIEEGVLTEIDVPVPDCVVLYSNESTITHAGRYVSSGAIDSKWGLGGLWRHKILEAPISYGDEIKYFSPINEQESASAFLEYSELLDALPPLKEDAGVDVT